MRKFKRDRKIVFFFLREKKKRNPLDFPRILQLNRVL